MQEIIERKEIEIFPNPSKDWIRIANSEAKFELFEIYNIIGEQVFMGTATENLIDIKFLEKGTFVLIGNEGNKRVLIGKFIKE